MDGQQVRGGRAHYDTNYGHFQTTLFEEIRREAFGEEIGQNSWLTAAEQDAFVKWLRGGSRSRIVALQAT